MIYASLAFSSNGPGLKMTHPSVAVDESALPAGAASVYGPTVRDTRLLFEVGTANASMTPSARAGGMPVASPA